MIKAIIRELYLNAHIGDSLMQNSYSQLTSIMSTKIISSAFNAWAQILQ